MTISLVQHAKNKSATGGAATVTVTFTGTTAGNCLVVAIGFGTVAATVSSVKLGGSGTGFASLTAKTGTQCASAIWANPDIAGGQTTLTVTASAACFIGVDVYEVSGLVTSSPLDKSASASGGSSTSWSSGATGTTADAAEFWCGVTGVNSNVTLTGPGSPWTSEAAQLGIGGGGLGASISGYQVTSATGTATWSGTASGSTDYAACAVTLLAPSAVTATASLTGAGTLTARGFLDGRAGLAGQGTLTAAPTGAGHTGLTGQGTLSAGASAVLGGSAALTGQGTLSAGAVNAGPGVVNQWKAAFSQPAGLGITPPALQSLNVTLTPANSVGAGSGYSTAGNWLFCLVGISEQTAGAGVTVGDADDIHSFWRPGDVPASQWAVSEEAALTRTSIWYTANIARQVNTVYVAPSGCVSALSVLVIEVNLAPWDTVSGIAAAYTAAGTSLSLALPAPSAEAFLIAAVTGDLSTAGQTLAPAGWSPLAAVTTTNGAGHAADCALTSAFYSTAGPVSVTATTGTASDLSGVIIGVLAGAPSPIPAGANPGWAGRFIMEAAFGAGFQTPADQMQWTVLVDNAWAPGEGIKRCWGISDQSGIPYMLGQLQSGTGSIPLDNFDGALSPARVGPSGPWSYTISGGGGVLLDEGGAAITDEAGGYLLDEGAGTAGGYFTVTATEAAQITAGQAFTDVQNPGTLFVVAYQGVPSGGNVAVYFSPAPANGISSGDVVTQISPVTGTPVRLRAALGTITGPSGAVVYDRWYILQRFALAWPEARNKALRNFVPLKTTDPWSVASLPSCPSAYRGEVEQDDPGWWWPADDQPLTAGVLPAVLRNAASGSTTSLAIALSPAGSGPTELYAVGGPFVGGGTPLGFIGGPGLSGVATYTVSAASGWMPGDPPSAPQSSQSGNPVTSQPGSNAWQSSDQAGNTGSNGWYLSAYDPDFPPLSGGVTVEGWYSYRYFGWNQPYTATDYAIIAAQPYCPLTLWELATSSGPVCLLQLDISGHLNLITYAGTTPTSHTVYTGSDLRDNSWHYYAVTLTATGWTVWMDGTARATGTAAGMTPAWSWLVINGDLGSHGGSAAGVGLVHSANTDIAHFAIYPAILPAYRITAHYWSAITGFGLLPVPAAVQLAPVPGGNQTTATPDGQNPEFLGGYGSQGGANGSFYSISAIVAAQAGSVNSGPSTWQVYGRYSGGTGVGQGDNASMSWTGVAPSFQVYNGHTAGTETLAAVTASDSETFKNGWGGGAVPFGIGTLGNGSAVFPPAALVQRVSGTAAASTTLTITLPAATTAGNCLVVCVQTAGSGPPTVSSVTLGGAADNFAVAAAVRTTAFSLNTDCEIWTDQSCAGGETTVVITATGTTGISAWVMEWSGIMSVTSGAADQFSTGEATTSATWSSGATGTPAQSDEVIIGAVGAINSGVLTAPGSPWTELPQLTSGTDNILAAAWKVINNGASQTYDGTTSVVGYFAAAVVTLKAVTSSLLPVATPTGDTVAERWERILGYAGTTSPARATDQDAAALVQAAGDVGGQQAGANLQNMVNSDNGFAFVDNCGTLSYRSRTHLDADITAGPVWYIGMDAAGGQQPFAGTVIYPNDPQRIYTAVEVIPYSPSGAALPVLTPADGAAVNTSQIQFGARPCQVTSYLQSTAAQQAQADWLYATFGQNERRAEQVTIDAASHPAAWGLVLGVNVSDLVQVYDAPLGAPATTGVFRVTQVARSLSYGANGSPVEAKATLTLDPVPASYWGTASDDGGGGGGGGATTPLSVTTTSLPGASDGTSYTAGLAAVGGTGTGYTWTVAAGSLPSWASLNGTSGVISGIPSGTGTASFTVQVTDSASGTATQALTITTSPATLQPDGPAGSWTLAWHDEFDDATGMSGSVNGLSRAKWNVGWYDGPSSPGGPGYTGTSYTASSGGGAIEYYGPGAISWPGGGGIAFSCFAPGAGPDAGTHGSTSESGGINTAGLMNITPNTGYTVPSGISSTVIQAASIVVEISAKFAGPNSAASEYWQFIGHYNCGNCSTPGYPDSGYHEEIDVWEERAIGTGSNADGAAYRFHLEAASTYSGGDSAPASLLSTDLSLAFHTYTIEYTYSSMTMWVDGQLVSNIAPSTAECQAQWATPQYLNLQFQLLSGYTPTGTGGATPWEVEYVRVFT